MSDDENVATQEERDIAEEVAKLILKLDNTKKPIKQSDIMSSLSVKPGRKSWRSVLTKTQSILKNLGMRLVETESTTKSFILVGKHAPLAALANYAPHEETADRTLLVLVLSYLFMKEGVVSEEDLMGHLRLLTIYDEGVQSHPYFGAVKKKVLGDFVEQLYLTISKSPTGDGNQVTWGYRAELEVSKKEILAFVCSAGFKNRIKPQQMLSHFQRAQQQYTAAQTDVQGTSQE